MKNFGIDQLAANNINQIKPQNVHKGKNNKNDFEKMLSESIKETNNLQLQANRAIEELATGRSESIHETMIAIEKATISFQMMMQIRNKIIDAYKEMIKTSM